MKIELVSCLDTRLAGWVFEKRDQIIDKGESATLM